jgi:hypothetical protein
MQGTVTASWKTLGAGKIEDSGQQTTAEKDRGGERDAYCGFGAMRDEDLENGEGDEWRCIFYSTTVLPHQKPAKC